MTLAPEAREIGKGALGRTDVPSDRARTVYLLRSLVDVGLEFKDREQIYAERLEPETIRDRVVRGLPATGTPLADLVEEFKRDLLPLCKNEASRQFLGFGDTGDDPAALAGGMLATATPIRTPAGLAGSPSAPAKSQLSAARHGRSVPATTVGRTRGAGPRHGTSQAGKKKTMPRQPARATALTLAITLASGLGAAVATQAHAASEVIRIDAGSSAAYTDTAGRVWEADRGYRGGATTANASRVGPSLTADPQLLKTMRYGMDFSYSIPVAAAGMYLIRLHTAELNFAAAGSRQFTVTAEGRAVAADLDLAKAPGQRNPWTLEVPVAVTDGRLDLRFTAVRDYAQVSAIEIFGGTPPPPVPTGAVIRIDAGSSAPYTDTAGRVWEADRGYQGGATTANASRVGPSLTADPQLLTTMRYGTDFTYSIPVAAVGTYLIRLQTSELAFATAGSRQFTVTAEGRAVAADLDLAKAPGQRSPWTLEVPVAITDGRLVLRFTALRDYAQVSAIEVISSVPADPYRLTWSDEFNGAALDATDWNARNNTTLDYDLAYITSCPVNVLVSNGNLIIRSQHEPLGGRAYTTGYLDTIGKQSWTYGRFEMRAQLSTQSDTSKGIWPAFWMRPNDGGVGEIDIMEAIGSAAGDTEWAKAHQTIHYDYVPSKPQQGHIATFGSSTHPSDGFHTYSIQWEPGLMIWRIDGQEVWRRDTITTPWLTEAFSRPFNLRLNQQVGGSWAGTPNAATAFPADFTIDWVRVYQKP